jgi:hypothetical protein
MSTLKNIAIRNGVISDAEIKPKFHKFFTEIVGKYGRMYEPELKLKVMKKNNLMEIYGNAALAFRLWRKGKVRLTAPKIGQLDQISEIFESFVAQERGDEKSE